MHGSYSVTRGQIIRVGVPKGPKYFRSMTEGELNDRNDIFLPMYYALFFLGTSNIGYSLYRTQTSIDLTLQAFNACLIGTCAI